MNDIHDQLSGAVADRAGFSSDDVRQRVSRRRRRRLAGVGVVAVGLLLGAGALAVQANRGDDAADLDIVTPPDDGEDETVEATDFVPDPPWGWTTYDLDGDGVRDKVSGISGAVLLTRDDGNVPLRDRDGVAITVPLEGQPWFTCNEPSESLYLIAHEDDGERVSVRLRPLRVVDGIGEWSVEPSFFFDSPIQPLTTGQGCQRFGTPPSDTAVADGSLSDEHVEATDLHFDFCANPLDIPQATQERKDELTAIYDQLVADGLNDPVPYFNVLQRGEQIQVGLTRRYQPTIDWFAARVDVDDLCWFLLPEPGTYTGAPVVADLDPVEVIDETTLRVTRSGCGTALDNELPAQVLESADAVTIMWPFRPQFGAVRLVCVTNTTTVPLSEPLAGREIVVSDSPLTMRLSPEMSRLPLDEPITIAFHVQGLGGDTTMGDDVMIQSVDDPSIQIQVSGVFTDDPQAGPPAPIVQDRWTPPLSSFATPTGFEANASIIVPSDTPPGDYTYIFIEHPQFNGVLTVG